MTDKQLISGGFNADVEGMAGDGPGVVASNNPGEVATRGLATLLALADALEGDAAWGRANGMPLWLRENLLYYATHCRRLAGS